MGKITKDIEERTIEIAKYIIEHDATIRKAAFMFGISKSTVHKDVSERLLEINQNIANKVKKVLETNKSERHIRGGQANKDKYNKKEV